MQFFDQNTSFDRIPSDVSPLVQGLLLNTQKFSEDADDPPRVTRAVKYHRQRQNRRQTSEYEGANPFVQEINEYFDFPPLDFQVNSWELVEELDDNRRNGGGEQVALFEAPTGFGKTEAFLGPVYKLLRDNPNETAVIVYPRRALLQNQLERVLRHLHNMRDRGPSDLSVGVYIGGMPYKLEDVEDNRNFFEAGKHARFKLANCWCGEEGESNAFEYHGTSNTFTLKCESDTDHSFTDRELMLARKDIADDPPNIILTTLESLELFALKPNYNIIDQVSTIVLDEVHLYTGLRGAHAANIVQNINAITDEQLLWLGASATVDNPSRFAKKLFGIQAQNIETVRPPDSDFKSDHDDHEHYYFLMSPEDGPGASSMMIQQLMLLGHSLLDKETEQSGKILTFIDSISQVNQKYAQLENADSDLELWRYHTSGDGSENWRQVANEMGYEFREDPLSLLRVYSDFGFDADAAVKSDLLLSTSFLEVGIDVGDISIISQYRTPQDLSSFIQRTGRAARKEGMNSHIFTHLSSLTGDSNMFYRAERFLASDLRTPLKEDNEVVEWIHTRLREFYIIGSDIRDNHHRSPREEELEFYQTFIRDSEGMEFPEFHRFLAEPGQFLNDELGVNSNINQPIISEESLRATKSALEEMDNSLREQFSDINDYVEIEGNEIIRGENAFDEYLNVIRNRVLEQISEYDTCLSEYSDRLAEADATSRESQIETARDALEDARKRVDGYRSLSKSERVERYDELLGDLAETGGQLLGIRGRARSVSDSEVPDIQLGELDGLQSAVDRLSGLAGDERLENLNQRQRQIFYLEKTVEELLKYRGFDDEYGSPPRKPYYSVWYVKFLLRASYYFNRFLTVDERASPKDVWYVPPNYFESSGQYFTVFQHENDLDGKDESIDSIVHSLAPYRAEYQAETSKSRLFMPQTEVLEASSDDEHSRVEFDFSNIPTKDRPNMRIPESVTLQEVTDLTEDSAQNIVRYCPECLQIISDLDNCLVHNDHALGKIHSDPQVSTVARDRRVEETTGGLSLCELTGEVTLEGVTLDITPATYRGPEIGHGWADSDRIQREIESPEPPLGFSVDTRGIVLDLSDYLSSLDDSVRDRVAKFKDFDEMSFENIAYHTAAHFLLQLVADIGGVNPSMLFYGMDKTREEIFVFERTEGGQGVVDLVYDELDIDPGNVLAAMNQTAFNPQVLNEQLWSEDDILETLPLDGNLDEDDAKKIVEDKLGIPFADVNDRVVQEFVTSADRCQQLVNSAEDIDLETAYRVKHEIAQAQLEGETEFPSNRIRELESSFEADEVTDTIQSLFVSPDIDGCVENLHLSECISGHSQQKSLSYILLEELYEHVTETVPRDEADARSFNREQLPAGEVNGSNIFVTF